MATVKGTTSNDFIHRSGDGLLPPGGFIEITGVTTGNDTITGLAGDDQIFGDKGDDTLNGGPGGDELDGGPGFDYASYADQTEDKTKVFTGVVADLLAPTNNTAQAKGDTYTSIEGLIGSDFIDSLTGNNADNILQGGKSGDRLDGGAGLDIASYSDATGGVTANLADPTKNADKKDSSGKTTDYAAGDTYNSIEGLIGSAFSDLLVGNVEDNDLRGGAGDDTLQPGGGADKLNGGAGFDYVTYADQAVAVTASLADSTTNKGPAKGDTYTDIEGLIGTAKDDTLTGDADDNILEGGAGADSLNGGGGFDYASYADAAAAVTANLDDSTTNTGDAAGDVYTAIEGLIGSAFADKLTGDKNDNILEGGPLGDALDGGDGTDLASYAHAKDGVTADLGTPANNTGDALLDTYTSIEGLVGSAKADTLTGDGNDNILRGLAGADSLSGGDGADTLDGGTGNDTLTGGAGKDSFVFKPTYQSDLVTDFKVADDKVDLSAFSITSFADVQKLWSQVGKDVVIDFGAGDVLTLQNVKTGDLTASNFSLTGATTFGTPISALKSFGASTAAGGWTSQDKYPRVTGDVNGDGKADIVGFGDTQTFVSLGSSTGAFSVPIQSIKSFGSSTTAGGWTSQDTTPRTVGDVNGDGFDDIVGFGYSGTWVALGDSDGTFGTPFLGLQSFGSSKDAGGWTSQDADPRVLADVNGDGRDDIIGFGFDQTYVSLANADGTFQTPTTAIKGFGASTAGGGWTSDKIYHRTAGDVNGDGKADIVGFGDGGTYVSLGNGDGTFGTPFLALASFGVSSAAGGWTTNDLSPRTLADVNDDGRDDIIGFGSAGTFVALGQPGGTFTTPVLSTGLFGSSSTAGGWTTNNTYPRTADDVTGDGRADLLGFGDSGVFVSLASASTTT